MSDLEAILETGGAVAVEIAASALSERGHATGTCANCSAPTIGAYCAVCGQERDTHRRSVWGLVKDLVQDIVSFDSRILRTAIALLVEPGEIANAFREGRTQRFVPALRLYFFVSLIFFLLLSMTGIAILQLEVIATQDKIIYDAKGHAFIKNPAYDPDDAAMTGVKPLIQIKTPKNKADYTHYSFDTRSHFFAPIGIYHSHMTPEQRAKLLNADTQNVVFGDDDVKKLPPAKRAQALKTANKTEGWISQNFFGGIRRLAADPAALNGPITTWIPRMLFLLLPLYAFLLILHYWRQHKKFYFVDHLIFSLSIHSFLFVVLIADVALTQILSGEMVAWLTAGALGIYIFIAMKRFYEQGWFWTTVKFLSVSFFYTVFFLAPAIGGVIVLSLLGDSVG